MVDQIIIGAYLFCVLLLGLWAGRGVKNIQEYSVVNRSYSSWIVFATLSASFIGGG
jgi:SSS family solute:Na+ symporter